VNAGLEVNPEKTKYMLMSHHWTTGQNHDVLVANKYFVNVVDFKYLETIKNNYCLHDKINS
jgi:hypothetical protein